MGKREFLQLAHPFKTKHRCSGMFMSEKLDGQRCFWDGGISRGQLCRHVLWANTEKDLKDRIATGLWSRYGKPISAPDDWLNQLSLLPLDGELYTCINDRQTCRSIVSRHEPDDRWSQVKFMIFGSPPLRVIFRDGVINSQHFKAEFNGILETLETDFGRHPTSTFYDTYAILQELPKNNVMNVLPQWRLSLNEADAKTELASMLDRVCDAGGEGLILQSPYATWTAERSWNVLKVKKLQDSEAKVIGYTWGDGKLMGLMGSMQISWKGKILSLSGFTDAERLLNGDDDKTPFSTCGPLVSGVFPIGSVVTFRYRGLTDDGVPTEARYWRKYETV